MREVKKKIRSFYHSPGPVHMKIKLCSDHHLGQTGLVPLHLHHSQFSCHTFNRTNLIPLVRHSRSNAYHTHLSIFLTHHTHHHCLRWPWYTHRHSPIGRRVHAWRYFHLAWRGVLWFSASSLHNPHQKRTKYYLPFYRSWGFNVGRWKFGSRHHGQCQIGIA